MDSLLFSFGSMRLEWPTILLSFLTAFLCSSLIAATYQKTYEGLSWSRGTVQSMVLGSLISCLLMIAIGDNVARGIGIVGSLAIIRFRTNLRDPRDLIFVFAALGVGVASGVQSYDASAMGTLIFCATAYALARSGFGHTGRFDALVRFQVPSGTPTGEAVAEVMRSIPRTFALVTLRDIAQGEMVDHAYQVGLGGDGQRHALLEALGKIDGMRGLTFMNQETTLEL
jgi:hypothetical protein